MIKKCMTALLISFLVFPSNADDILRDIEKAGRGEINGAVGCSIYIIKSGYEFVNFIHGFIWPNPETKLRKELAVKHLEILDTEDQLNRCLVKNKKGEKEQDGLPRACGEISKFYAVVLGQQALEKIAIEYNHNK